jgi:hypothetical protein
MLAAIADLIDAEVTQPINCRPSSAFTGPDRLEPRFGSTSDEEPEVAISAVEKGMPAS